MTVQGDCSVEKTATATKSGALFKRILVTNDDGYGATGIQILTEIAEQLAHEVWVVAPESDQSGTGQSISLHHPLRIRQVSERHYSVKGTPADCVLLACFHLLPEKPDLVLSGINRGINLADAMGFSGTLGAATTASLFDIPAVALSQAWKDAKQIHWHTGRQFAPDILRQLFASMLPAGITVNINFPSVPPLDVKGLKNTAISASTLTSAEVIKNQDLRALDYYWLTLKHRYGQVHQPHSDVQALREGYISLSFIEQAPDRGVNPELFQRFKLDTCNDSDTYTPAYP